MNFGYFWVFWRIFFGYTGIPLLPLADPDLSPFGNVCQDPNVKANALSTIRPDFIDRSC